MPLTTPPRYRPLITATVMVATAVVALSAKWMALSPATYGWPRDNGRVISILFTAGVMLAFGAATVSAMRWRRVLQCVAAVCLIGMLVLPIDVNRWLPPPTYKVRHDEQHVTVRVRPTVEHTENGDYAVLRAAEMPDAPARLYLGRELAAKLPRDQIVEFTLWRTRDVVLPGWRVKGDVGPWNDELEMVRSGDQVLYDARVCPIHHVTMQRLELPIHYGLPAFSPEWGEFSGGPGFVLGGCVVGPQRTAIGYRCPMCAERYEKWAAEIQRRYEQQEREKRAAVN